MVRAPAAVGRTAGDPVLWRAGRRQARAQSARVGSGDDGIRYGTLGGGTTHAGARAWRAFRPARGDPSRPDPRRAARGNLRRHGRGRAARRRHGDDGAQADLRRGRSRGGRDRARPRAARDRTRRRRRPVGRARAGASDLPDRHRQDRRGLAALRRRRAARAHRNLPARRRGRRSADLGKLRRQGARRDHRAGPDRGRSDRPRRPDPARSAQGGSDARHARLYDLYFRLDRDAQGHRHHRTQHLPLPALGQRNVQNPTNPTSSSRAPRSPSTCRWRKSGFPIWSARRFSSPRPR